MKKKLFLLSFIFVSLCEINFAGASAFSCQSFFPKTVQEIITQLNLENSQVLWKHEQEDPFVRKMSWYRRRQIRQLNNIDIKKLVSAQQVERYAIEMSGLLFASPQTVDRFIFKNKSQRLEETTFEIIKEKLLRQGMLKVWSEQHDPDQVTRLQKWNDGLAGFVNKKFFRLVGFPMRLPGMDHDPISNELMFAIIKDGFDAHAEEVRIVLKRQSAIEAYNAFRRVYAPIVIISVMAYNAQITYHDWRAQTANQVQTVITQLQKEQAELKTIAPQIRQEQIELALQRSVAHFIAKWGEPPTPEELAIMRRQIETAIGKS